VVHNKVGLLIFWVLMTRTLLVKKYVGEITRIYKFPRRFSHVPFIQQALGNVCNFFGPRCTSSVSTFSAAGQYNFFFFFLAVPGTRGKNLSGLFASASIEEEFSLHPQVLMEPVPGEAPRLSTTKSRQCETCTH